VGRQATRKGPASNTTKRAGRRGSVASWKSEKFAGNVRISLEKWPKVRNSSKK
jgi:hypothetical protein